MLQKDRTNYAEFKFPNFKRKRIMNYLFYLNDYSHLIKHYYLDLEVVFQTSEVKLLLRTNTPKEINKSYSCHLNFL